MNKFKVIPIDQEKFGVGRWNEFTGQYDLIGRTYPTKELAEIALQGMIDLYNEGTKEQ